MLPKKKVEKKRIDKREQDCWLILKTCRQKKCVKKVVGLVNDSEKTISDKLENLLKTNQLEYIRNGNQFELEDKVVTIEKRCEDIFKNNDYKTTSYIFMEGGE